MWEGVGDRTELQHIDPHSIGHDHVSFPFSWAAQPEAWWPSPSGCWFSLPHLISNSSDPQLSIGGLRAPSAGCWHPLPHLVCNWSGLQTALSYIIVHRPPSSCGRHKLHSFNPSTVKATLCYSSTGCTSYSHRCIFLFWQPCRVVGQYTTLHPLMKFKFCRSEDFWVPRHCHYTQTSSDLERLYLLGSRLWVK